MKRALQFITVLLLAICYTGGFCSAFGATVTLPCVQGFGYSTTVNYNNPTFSNVNIPNFYPQFGARVVIPSFRTTRFPCDAAGISIVKLEVPSPLQAYAEIRDPNGVLVRIHGLVPLKAGSKVQLPDLLTDDGFKTYLFLLSPEGSLVTVRDYGDGQELGSGVFRLEAGVTQIPTLPAGSDRATVQIGLTGLGAVHQTGDVYLFALISRQPRGEIHLVAPRSVE